MVLSFISCLSLFTTFYIGYKYYLKKTKQTFPKNKSKKLNYSEQISKYKRVEIERDRFSKRKIPENIHNKRLAIDSKLRKNQFVSFTFSDRLLKPS